MNEYVEAVALARLQAPDALKAFAPTVHEDTEPLRDEAAATSARLDSVAVEFADGELTAGQLRTVNERLRARLADLEARIAEAGRTDIVAPLLQSGDVAGQWSELSTARKRTVIDLLMKVVLHPPGRGVRHFDPSTVEIIWRQ